MKNRYAGCCHYCGVYVAAGAGQHDASFATGRLSCSDVVTFTQGDSLCDMPPSEWNAHHQRFTKVELDRGLTCLRQYNAICGTAYTSVDEIRAKRRAEIEANKPTPEQVARNQAASRATKEADRKRRRAELAALKAANICPRCGGAGGSDAWLSTGWTCHRCHGTGKHS